MPLHHGTSKKTFSRNVSEMMHAGHPQKQAVAAAYSMKRSSGHKSDHGFYGHMDVEACEQKVEVIGNPPMDVEPDYDN